MLGDSKQASSVTTSLVYLTTGALIDVWAIVYFFYLRNHDGTDIAYLYVYGFIFTGVVLFLIGLAVGRIGHSARSAEVAPTPTQQVVAASPMVAPLPANIVETPDPPAAQVPMARQGPVTPTGVSVPTNSFATSERRV